jgi:hypothetical protein
VTRWRSVKSEDLLDASGVILEALWQTLRKADCFAQAPPRHDLEPRHHCGLGRVLRRDQDAHLALLARAQGNGPHPFPCQDVSGPGLRADLENGERTDLQGSLRVASG